jgi:hypothetical protein
MALSPFVSSARGAGERYIVNYRADAASPWLEYTTTRGLAQARSAVAELEALGYQADYVTEPVGPVYSGGTYSYAPGYTYYPTGGSFYDHYQYNDHTADRYHYHHAHHHHYGHHHAHDYRYDYHHHDVHHRVRHHHSRHHHTGHHAAHHHR